MRGWRLALAGAAGLVATAAMTVLTVALNVATGGSAHWFPTMDQYPLCWAAGASVAVAGAGLLLWRVQGWYDRSFRELVPAIQRPEPWVVERPDKVNQIIAALGRRPTMGITTAVHGAGGFGKTTIAKMVRTDRRVLRRFKSRIYWVTLGRDTGREALAELINGLVAQLEPDRPVTFTDARQAGVYLAAVLAKGPRRLLVLDDVWTQDQLAVFLAAGQCARLVTTRNPSLVPRGDVPITADEMSEKQATAVLLAGLPPLPPRIAFELVGQAGRWPVLLRLVNGILTDQSRLDSDLAAVAEDLLGRLRTGGMQEIDKLTGADGQRLDVSDPDQRARAVGATIKASTGLLGPDEHDRLTELTVFAKNETIPVPLITALWRATHKLDPIAARALCARLADLALLVTAPGGTVTMHDVIRDYLIEETGATRLAELNGILLDAIAEDIPAAGILDDGPTDMMVTAWWQLGTRDGYMWDRLIEHLLQADRLSNAEAVATDLRWVGARLQRSGPAAPAADLSLVGTPRTTRLQGILGRAAHLLAPSEPPDAVVDVLHSRVASDPEWGPQVTAMRVRGRQPRLVNRWTLPDLPDPALRHNLTGHRKLVTTIVVAPDGSWLAAGDLDGTVRFWDPGTGRELGALTDVVRGVTAMAFAPDGSWLATGSMLEPVRILDFATGRERATLTGYGDSWVGDWSHWASAMVVAPDGSWLAVGSSDGIVRFWDPSTSQLRAALTAHRPGDHDEDVALAVAPDGSWVATSGTNMTVRTWDVATSKQRSSLSGCTSRVTAVAVAPDGSWLTAGGEDGTVRIWDVATSQERVAPPNYGSRVTALAVAPDGSWMAIGAEDGTVRIWDVAAGQHRAALTGRRKVKVEAIAVAPDGSWLATADNRMVRIWDLPTGQEQAMTARNREVTTLAAAPDGSWLATLGEDGTVGMWDTATGQQKTASTPLTDTVTAVAVAPDGSWMATGGADRTVRIWDTATGRQKTILTGRNDAAKAVSVPGIWPVTGRRARSWDLATGQNDAVTAVAVARDGSWLAACGRSRVWTWDMSTQKQLAALRYRQTFAMNAIAIAPDCSWVALGGNFGGKNGTVRIWDPATRKHRFGAFSGGKAANALIITPDGSRFANDSRHFLADRAGRIWNLITRDASAWLDRWARQVDAVHEIAIAPDGRWLATANSSAWAKKGVIIWDAATLQQVAVLTGFGTRVNAAAVTPDGRWLATGCDIGTVRIWNTATWQQQALFRVEGPVTCCAWLGTDGLAVGGVAGLYMFDFLAGVTVAE